LRFVRAGMMRKLTLALLSAAYLCLALIVALTLWRNGGGWAAGVSALLGGLALCFALHEFINRGLESGRLQDEIDDVREANAILVGQIERIDARLSEVIETVVDDAERSREALTSEVHMLEDAVQRMSDRLENQLSSEVARARSTPGSRRGGAGATLLDAVRDALADNRVDLYLQPIVGLPQRRMMFYESFSRLRDAGDRVLMPAEYLPAAEPAGLVTAIDNLLLFRCVQVVRRLSRNDRKIGIFCNISLASLGDETFFPQFLEFLSSNRDLSASLIFELGQDAFNERGPVEARHMARLAQLGFKFSIDKVHDLDIDYQELARADVKFVKVAAQMLIEELEEEDGHLVIRSLPDLHASDFAALTRRYGLEVVVEKVESERQIAEILDLDIGYGQGNLFGEPRVVRNAVLNEAEPPVDFARAAAARRRAGGMR
jgi:cyclic-di-GMP phosphodiesterase, flagellum assembly factor TipF